LGAGFDVAAAAGFGAAAVFAACKRNIANVVADSPEVF
jgi:hypothetical protein